MILASCNHKPSADCTPTILENAQMVPYTGSEIFETGCVLYLQKYEWNEQFYFQFDGTCIDALFNPVDCDGNAICADNESINCQRFLLEAIDLGIIGYLP